MSGLTKNLFNCKSNSQQQINYEYLPYQSNNQTSNTTMQFSNHPATSTMIESQENLNTISYNQMCNNNYHLISSQESTHSQNEISIERQNIENECMRMQYYKQDNFALDETEQSRCYSISDLSVTATQNSDYEMVTIVPHNNSPLSDYKNYDNMDDTGSTCSLEYLHSTKLSSVAENHCSTQLNCSCQINTHKSPLSSTDSNIGLESPLLSSSSITPESNSGYLLSSSEENEIELQLRTYQSMISNLSTTLNDEESDVTHICTNNYEATFVDDISVHFADTVRILRNDNEEWLYVQVASDGRQGFVPKTIVLDLKQFIDQLKQHHTQVQIKAKRSV